MLPRNGHEHNNHFHLVSSLIYYKVTWQMHSINPKNPAILKPKLL